MRFKLLKLPYHTYLILLGCLLITGNITAQQITQNVKGTVIDKQSEYPLPDAEVIVTAGGKTYGAVTGFDGKYVITGVPVGKIDIEAHYQGFKTQSYKQLELTPGKELVVDFYLLENLETLDEVVIKATGKRDNVAFVTTSTASFNVEQTEQYAGTLNDVSRMAMNYAGVNGNDDSRNDIIVRGNNPASLLWMIEGVSVPSPNHYSTTGSSGGPVSMLNINTLSRSDFLTGAFPANFGNTTSAAFDLQFKKPNKDQYEYVGQIGFAGAELGIEGPVSRQSGISFLTNYRYSTLSLIDKMGFDLGVGTAVPEYQDINAVVDIPTSKAGTFRLWGIGGISNILLENFSEEDNNNYFDKQASVASKDNQNLITGFSHKYFWSPKTYTKLSYSYSRIDERVKIDTMDTDTGMMALYYKQKILTRYHTADLKLNTKINAANRISGGITYTGYVLDLDTELNGVFHDILSDDTGLGAVYVNWQHRFTGDIVLNAGIRTQYFTLNDKVSVEPRLGIKYDLNGHSGLSLAYGLHSNILPLLAYFTKQPLDDGTYGYANHGVGYLKSHHLVAGYTHTIGRRLQSKVEVYYQYLFNVPISHDDPTYSIINSGFNEPGGAQLFFDRLYNEGYGKNYGIDLTVEYPLHDGFYTLLTGSLYESQYKAYDGIWRNTAWNGNYMASLLTGKSWKTGEKTGISLDLNMNYSGGRRYIPVDLEASQAAGTTVYAGYDIFEHKLKDYFRTDLKAGFYLNGKHIRQEWQVDLRNVFDRKNIFSREYNVYTGQIQTAYQAGFFPVVQYKILF